MDNDSANSYGTSREAIFTLTDGNGNEVTFKVPNAKYDLSSDSAVVTAAIDAILAEPETEDDFQVFTVKGQPVTAVKIDLVTTTKTLIRQS